MITALMIALLIGVVLLCAYTVNIIAIHILGDSLNFTMSPQQKYETGMLPLCYNISKALNSIISESCSMMYGGPVVPN